jgi:hypothetical protein
LLTRPHETRAAALERIKWLLWHGNAPEAIEDIECLADEIFRDLEENPGGPEEIRRRARRVRDDLYRQLHSSCR